MKNRDHCICIEIIVFLLAKLNTNKFVHMSFIKCVVGPKRMSITENIVITITSCFFSLY